MSHDFEVMKICVCAYLRSLKEKQRALQDISERLARIRSSLEMQGVSFDDVPHAHNPSSEKMSNGVSKILSLQADFNERAGAWTDSMNEFISACDPVNTSRWVCYLHYAEGMKWQDVARKACYSVSHVKRLGDVGICELYPLIPEEYRRESIPNAAPN